MPDILQLVKVDQTPSLKRSGVSTFITFYGFIAQKNGEILSSGIGISNNGKCECFPTGDKFAIFRTLRTIELLKMIDRFNYESICACWFYLEDNPNYLFEVNTPPVIQRIEGIILSLFENDKMTHEMIDLEELSRGAHFWGIKSATIHKLLAKEPFSSEKIIFLH